MKFSLLLSASHWMIEKHLALLCAETEAKLPDRKPFRFVLAPINLKLLSLIGPVPHAFGLGCCPVGGANLAA